MTAAFTKQKFKIPTISHKIDQTGNCWLKGYVDGVIEENGGNYGTAEGLANFGTALLTVAGGIAAVRAIAALSVSFEFAFSGPMLALAGFGSNGGGIALTGTITGTQVLLGIGAVSVYRTGNSGEYLDGIQQAMQQFRSNRQFQNWFHKYYKQKYGTSGGGRTNPDMVAADIREAWEMWIELGRPML